MSVLSLLPGRLLRLLPLLPLLLVALFYASPLPAQDELPPGTATNSVDTAAVQRPALPPLAASPQAAVAVCLDGDTLKLTSRRTVRLAGIDTPEMGKRDKKPQYYAREARELLNELSRGQDVTLYQPSNKQQDKYGRLIADICLPDGRSLNALMVEAGAAFFYPHADLDPAYQDWLKSLQAAAIHERRGMWAHILSLPQAQETYVGNRNSRRFFPSDSAESQKIKPRNRVFFGNLMDAFMAGYSPARTKKGSSLWPDA